MFSQTYSFFMKIDLKAIDTRFSVTSSAVAYLFKHTSGVTTLLPSKTKQAVRLGGRHIMPPPHLDF